GIAVRGDGHADAGGAAEDAEVALPGEDGGGDEAGVVGIVDGFLGEGTRVLDLVALAAEVRDEGFLEFESTVVGADDERGFLHGLSEGREWLKREGWLVKGGKPEIRSPNETPVRISSFGFRTGEIGRAHV